MRVRVARPLKAGSVTGCSSWAWSARHAHGAAPTTHAETNSAPATTAVAIRKVHVAGCLTAGTTVTAGTRGIRAPGGTLAG